jgi:response regulator of citrate/malate metabolism
MKKILIIDDAEEILFAISEFFKMKDWEVYTSENVEEALKIIQENTLDIIIIDYHMPHINGVTGVRIIRMTEPDIPIIAMTIESNEETADEFFRAGVSDFAIKPIKMLDLYSRVNVHLKIRENTRTTPKVREYQKGITESTVKLIEENLKDKLEFMTIEKISEITGLAPQTVNKYMVYLNEIGGVELEIDYGKRGRPKNKYRFKKE